MSSRFKKTTSSTRSARRKDMQVSETKNRGIKWTLGILLAVVIFSIYALTVYWSIEPSEFDVVEAAREDAGLTDINQDLPSGAVYTNTLARMAETVLNKNGGYLSNDIFPGGLIDNMPAWEFGALVMIRDATTALRNHFARSQSQSKENFQLSKAEPSFYFTHTSYWLPATEDEYQKGIDNLRVYLKNLNDPNASTAHFYARADNLSQYLQVVEKRLGDYSHRLSASSVQKHLYNFSNDKVGVTKTPWLEVDDVFWEARGATWALLHILNAVKADFKSTLKGKAALATMQQIIHELEDSQSPIMSPMILNGDGFGLFANYSLTMANYITRANASTLDLRDLMMRG